MVGCYTISVALTADGLCLGSSLLTLAFPTFQPSLALVVFGLGWLVANETGLSGVSGFEGRWSTNPLVGSAQGQTDTEATVTTGIGAVCGRLVFRWVTLRQANGASTKSSTNLCGGAVSV